MNLADIRKEYTQAGLRRAELDPDPLTQFQKWFRQAEESGVLEPSCMTLATADKSGRPSARTVLLKNVDERGFAFFTNYESRKGRELAENPRAALALHWREPERQVCITGDVSKLSRAESEKYFHSRPRGSQLGAWVSRQGEVIARRDVLEKELAMLEKKYPDEVPLPPHWGGYMLAPDEIQFWQGRPDRLHDRFRYSRQSGCGWKIERLAP
ncbi:MAG: pyridoxamine 5'-phosphate oxidase [Pedosphaera sp.]|nr:pyridoxamine 5'-phosphate oxidase [Pedosphaera sp.]